MKRTLALFLFLSSLLASAQCPQTWTCNFVVVPSTTSAVVTWNTAVPATGQVRYGLTSSYGTRTTNITTRSLAHSATILKLLPDTTYYVQAIDSDAQPTFVYSAGTTFHTKALALIAVSVSPSSASLLTGGTQQFTATVTGTTNTAVTWSATGGTVVAGLYTAPATAGTYSVRATSVADPTKSAAATVTVTVASTHNVALSWQASVSPNVSGYNLYRSLDQSSWTKLNSGVIGGLVYDDSTVANGSTYYYRATAVDISNLESVPSSVVSAVIPQ